MLLAAYMVPHPPIAVPEIGKGEEQKIPGTLRSFSEVARDIARLRPDTIILSSPHATMYRDYFHISPGEKATGDFRQFGAKGVGILAQYDQELAKAVSLEAQREGFPAGMEGEQDPALDHGTTVPLSFIEREYRDYRLLRVGLSGLPLEDHWHFGAILRKVADRLGRRFVFVASGDLSHCQKKDGPYGYRPAGPEYDRRIMETMGKGAFRELLYFPENFLRESMECGHRSFAIMAGALDGLAVEPRALSHEDTFGVGYGFCIYHVGE